MFLRLADGIVTIETQLHRVPKVYRELEVEAALAIVVGTGPVIAVCVTEADTL